MTFTDHGSNAAPFDPQDAGAADIEILDDPRRARA